MVPIARFSEHAHEYDKHAKIQRLSSETLVNASLKHSNPVNVCDIGCGTGLTSEVLLRAHPDITLTCCDTSYKMLNAAEERLGKGRKYHKGTLPGDSGYDLIISNFAFQWVKDPAVILQQCMNKLNSRGILAVAFPVKGTFTKFQEASEACGIKNSVLNYSDEIELLQSMQEYECILSEVSELEDIFPDTFTFLKCLHSTGATLKNKNISSGELRRIMKAHDGLFDNSVNVIYRVWTAIFRRE